MVLFLFSHISWKKSIKTKFILSIVVYSEVQITQERPKKKSLVVYLIKIKDWFLTMCGRDGKKSMALLEQRWPSLRSRGASVKGWLCFTHNWEWCTLHFSIIKNFYFSFHGPKSWKQTTGRQRCYRGRAFQVFAWTQILKVASFLKLYIYHLIMFSPLFFTN